MMIHDVDDSTAVRTLRSTLGETLDREESEDERVEVLLSMIAGLSGGGFAADKVFLPGTQAPTQSEESRESTGARTPVAMASTGPQGLAQAKALSGSPASSQPMKSPPGLSSSAVPPMISGTPVRGGETGLIGGLAPPEQETSVVGALMQQTAALISLLDRDH